MNNRYHDKITFDAKDIQRYLNGQMSAKEMHAIEHAAMEDAFLADAIEGYGNHSVASELDAGKDLSELRMLIRKRIKLTSKRVFLANNYQWWKIAAIIIVLAGSGTLIYYLANNSVTPETSVVKNTMALQKDNVSSNSREGVANNLDTTGVALHQPKAIKSKTSVFNENQPPVERKTGTLPLPSGSPGQLSTSIKKPDTLLLTDELANRQLSIAEKENELSRRSEIETASSVLGSRSEIRDQVFKGRVVNQKNQPLANVDLAIFSKAKSLDVLTDSNGYFSFATPDSLATVVINQQGFVKTKISMEGNATGKKIMLTPREQPLSKNKAPVISSPEINPEPGEQNEAIREAVPVAGMKAFKAYVENYKKRVMPQDTIHGPVTVSFYVEANGNLTNFNIIKSLSVVKDAEAIRLIRNGPIWKVVKNKMAKAIVTIDF